MAELNEQQIREIIREELSSFNTIERYTFQKNLQIFDGRNIQTGRTTGTKIGTAIDQKIGLYGVTPVIQGTTISDPTISTVSGSGADATINANFASVETAIETLIDRLQDLGVIA